jgi:CDP-4-dehydro-6-deoxyglucose reductase, E3
MHVVTVTSGRQFEAAESELLLDAAMRSGITLAYSCRTGRCGTCKCKVSKGATLATRDEISLSDAERADGWILTCTRTALSDLALDVDDLADVRLFPARTYPCRILSLNRVSYDVVVVKLRLPPNSPFSYSPGQYVDLIGRDGLRRSYSIANAPVADGSLELHIRSVRGGLMSRYFFEEAKTNDLLRLHGPLGTFLLRDIEGMDVVFLATGTGIAPVKAILEDLVLRVQPQPRSVQIYWGMRVLTDLYWNILESGGKFEYIPVLSREDPNWTGARGYVQQAVLGKVADWSRSVVYACGSEAMIHDARQLLVPAGLDERRFFSDAFVPSG